MDHEPDYIVIRPGPGLPDGFLPPEWNGRWLDLRHVPTRNPHPDPDGQHAWRFGEGVAIVTDRFETSDDGKVAQVYEVRV